MSLPTKNLTITITIASQIQNEHSSPKRYLIISKTILIKNWITDKNPSKCLTTIIKIAHRDKKIEIKNVRIKKKIRLYNFIITLINNLIKIRYGTFLTRYER
jgi:hypothetical protein